MTSDSQPPTMVLRALLLTDLVDSTRLTAAIGDRRAAEVGAAHDRMARQLCGVHGGREIDKTDGFLLLFDHPLGAVRFALEYHRGLAALSAELGVELRARGGIHFGEVVERANPPEHVARGAKPLEVEGLAKPLAARVMSLAGPGQTLLTRGAFDLARRAAVGNEEFPPDIMWLAHGPYVFKGVEDATDIFEVGPAGVAPLAAPPDSDKAKRALRPGEEDTLGWRPAPGGAVPGRENWVLGDKLGEGGFGEVWLATHRKTRDPRVFKFCFDPDRLRGLKREVTLFRLLKETLGDRDDIAKVLDWSFDAAPFFIEGEYTPGGNLIDWAGTQGGISAIPLPLRLELVAQVATALAAAHSIGVLHKDIKPSNILIFHDREGTPRARLTDFGIGLITDRERLAQAGVTATGLTETALAGNDSSRTGTRLYMAPELAEGKPATIQSDIFALGVMLYQVVAGDHQRALAEGWRDHIPDELLCEDIAACVGGDVTRRLASADLVAERLRGLEERHAKRTRALEEKARSEAAVAALASANRRRRLARIALAGGVIILVAVGSQWWRALRAEALAVGRAQETEKALKETESARKEAESQRQLAETARDSSERLLATSSVQLADSWLREHRGDLARESLAQTPAHLRNWDWGYLRAAANPELITFRGHTEPVNSTALSPDGTRVVTASMDKTARIWDVATGAAVAVLEGHTGVLVFAAFSPDGTRIVTTSLDKTARVWDAATGAPVATLLGHSGEVDYAAFSSDGARIVSVSRDKVALAWNAITGASIIKPVADALAISPDGARIVTGADDISGELTLRDATTGNPIATLGGPSVWSYTVKFSPHGQLVAARASGNKLHVWDAATGSQLATLSGERTLNPEAFSPDGSLLLTTSTPNTTQVWDLSTSSPITLLDGPADMWNASFSNDNSRIVSVFLNNTGAVWNANTGALIAMIEGINGVGKFTPDGSRVVGASSVKNAAIWDAAPGTDFPVLKKAGTFAIFSRDGKRLITGGGEGEALVRVRDSATGSVITTLEGHTASVNFAAFGAEGAHVLTTSADKTARVWDVQTGAPLITLVGHTDAVILASFSPDGARLLTGSHDKTARLWDARTGAQIAILEGHTSAVSFAAFSPDGSRVVTASLRSFAYISDDHTPRLWDGMNGASISTLTGHTKGISSAAFSPDGSCFMTASVDRTIRLWEIGASSPQVAELVGKMPHVSAAFSPNSALIVSTSGNGIATLWDVAARAPVATLEGHLGIVWDAAFSPDGSRIATASSDNTARIWDASTGAALAILRGHSDQVKAVTFSPDGTRILTSSNEDPIRIWEAAPWREVTGSTEVDGLPIEQQFTLGQLKRYRDWQVRRFLEGEQRDLNDLKVHEFCENLTARFREMHPDRAVWIDRWENLSKPEGYRPSLDRLNLLLTRSDQGEQDWARAEVKKRFADLDAAALNERAWNWVETGRQKARFQIARVLSEEAVAREPDNWYFQNTLTWVHLRRGESATAMEQLKKASEMPDAQPVHMQHTKALAHALAGDVEEGWADLLTSAHLGGLGQYGKEARDALLERTPEAERATRTAQLKEALARGKGRLWLEPSPPVPGTTATVSYRAAGPFANHETLLLHWGVNSWQTVMEPDVPLRRSDSPGVWTVTLSVPESATELNLVVHNGEGIWDNNGGDDWHFAVAGEEPVSEQE